MALDEGALHVWRVALDGEPDGASLLSSEERGRAGRLRFDADRLAFSASRAALRTILGRYLDREPAAIRFAVTAAGKPSVVDGDGVSFSLSRSAPVALVAVARGRAVGVDVERLRPMPDLDSLARRILSPSEAASLGGRPEPDRLRAFFDLWTRKEAVVKATGGGIADGLDHLDVSRDAGEGATPWTVRSINVGPGSAAAVAVLGDVGSITVRETTSRG